MMKVIFYLVISLFIPCAYANFMVYPMSTNLQGDGSSLIRIYSKSGDILYVKTRVVKIINPGSPDEKEVNVPGWAEGGIVVSPAKIIVPAGGNRAVRLVSLSHPEQETLYRVYFEGVPSANDLSGDIASSTDKKKASVSLNIIFGVLVRVLPKVEHIQLNVIRGSKGEISLRNDGNVRVGITGIDLCPTEKNSDNCVHHSYARSLYPEQQTSVIASNSVGFSWVRIHHMSKDGEKEKTVLLPL
ncbi:hypothetical protein [Escherichia coli]|uniref:hypothetical protein n=1 Tax=Escherichia coli TaxID=562 RepID=UPI0037C11EB2